MLAHWGYLLGTHRNIVRTCFGAGEGVSKTEGLSTKISPDFLSRTKFEFSPRIFLLEPWMG